MDKNTMQRDSGFKRCDEGYGERNWFQGACVLSGWRGRGVGKIRRRDRERRFQYYGVNINRG